MLVPTTILSLSLFSTLSLSFPLVSPSSSRDTVTASRIVCSADPRKEIWYTVVWETKLPLIPLHSPPLFTSVSRQTIVFLSSQGKGCKVTPFPFVFQARITFIGKFFSGHESIVGWHDSRVFRGCALVIRVERTSLLFSEWWGYVWNGYIGKISCVSGKENWISLDECLKWGFWVKLDVGDSE